MTNLPLAIARWYPYSLDEHNEIKVDLTSEYFTGDLYLNGVSPGDRVAIVDDTISTGGALIALIKAIRDAGADVTEAICVIEKLGNGGSTGLRRNRRHRENGHEHHCDQRWRQGS